MSLAKIVQLIRSGGPPACRMIDQSVPSPPGSRSAALSLGPWGTATAPQTISNDTAFETARAAARLEGIPGGISSGAAIAAALEVGARRTMDGRQIVTIIPSFAERYLSTALFEGM